jgi:two-component sensor histidine kinase
MAMVHESLYKSDNLSRIDLRQYIKDMVLHIQAQYKTACDIRLEMRAVGIDVGLDVAVPCGLILNELITNAFKHAFPEGVAGDGAPEVKVVTAAQEGILVLTVADNGVGFPGTVDLGETQTLGLSLVRMLSQQLRGRVESIGTTGTVIRVQFPLPAK